MNAMIKAEWNKAIGEGRVVRFEGGEWFKSYPTAEAARAAVTSAEADGFEAHVVDPAAARLAGAR